MCTEPSLHAVTGGRDTCDDTRATVNVIRTSRKCAQVCQIYVLQTISLIKRRDPSDKLPVVSPLSYIAGIVELDALDDVD